jgi:carbon storage regulator CsrA
MLVLTRKVQEQIQIGATVTVTVLKTSGKTVKLGISGPPEVPILRAELTAKSGKRAGQSSPDALPRPAARDVRERGARPCRQSLLAGV